MSAQPMPRTGTYRLSDTLPDNASDSAYVSHFAYLIAQNPAWALGLRRHDGTLYYTPNRDRTVTKKAA